MRKEQIDRFFQIVGSAMDRQASVILTGAAAGNLMGNVRPSLDIDFAIRSKSTSPRFWEALDKAIAQAEEETGIQAEYAADIDRWGMISLLDYEKKARRYKKFNNLTVFLMDPAHWSIGKLTRYLDSDIQDVKAVFKKKKPSLPLLIKTWAKAVQKSPPSPAQNVFIRHVDHFLKTVGPAVWGKEKTERAREDFKRVLKRK